MTEVKPPPPTSRPQPPRPAQTPAKAEAPRRSATIKRGKQDAPQKTVIYGPGGVGKTKLASLASEVGKRVIFIDLEAGTKYLDVARVDDCQSFEDVRGILNPASDALDEFDFVVVDSGTKLEELAVEWTLKNVATDKGTFVKNVEGYGFGKGFTNVYETFLLALGDLDNLYRRGKSICIICHECVSFAVNPFGEDFARYEPRLQSPASGKASIRLRVKEWCDHLLFVGYDVVADKNGKAIGSGSRTIYTCERPTHMAKSRTLPDEQVVYEDGSFEIWKQIFGKETQ